MQKYFSTEKKSSNRILFATLALAKICLHHLLASALIKFEVLPTETWTISQEIFLELPSCCSENPPNCEGILINTKEIALHQGNRSALMIFHETPKNRLKVFGSL